MRASWNHLARLLRPTAGPRRVIQQRGVGCRSQGVVILPRNLRFVGNCIGVDCGFVWTCHPYGACEDERTSCSHDTKSRCTSMDASGTVARNTPPVLEPTLTGGRASSRVTSAVIATRTRGSARQGGPWCACGSTKTPLKRSNASSRYWLSANYRQPLSRLGGRRWCRPAARGGCRRGRRVWRFPRSGG